MFRPLFCENSSPPQCFAKILALFSAVAKCLGNLSENAKYLGNMFQKNGLEIEDRKSRKSKVAKYSKILADLPSEQIFLPKLLVGCACSMALFPPLWHCWSGGCKQDCRAVLSSREWTHSLGTNECYEYCELS